MSSPTLKSLLGKRTETTAWLHSWVSATNTEITIEDNERNLLFGNEITADSHEGYPVILNEETVGRVMGSRQAPVIASLFSLLIRKEAERKKMATEVLNLYQELNVIYNFSEKLTQTIDPDIIAQQ